MMRDASLERTPYGSLLDSPAFGALRDRGTTRRPTTPRQGSGRRVSSRLSVTRAVTAGGHPPGWPDPAGRGSHSGGDSGEQVVDAIQPFGDAVEVRKGIAVHALEFPEEAHRTVS